MRASQDMHVGGAGGSFRCRSPRSAEVPTNTGARVSRTGPVAAKTSCTRLGFGFSLLALPAPVVGAASDWRIEGDQAGAHLGAALAVGDFNGDGHGDVLVSAPDHDGEFANEGRVALYLGSSGGMASHPSWTMNGRQLDAHLGSVLAAAGDVNGDGYEDALIGAPDFDTSRHVRRHPAGEPAPVGADQGRVWLVFGSPTGFASAPRRVLSGLTDAEHLGAALAGAGDVNGDGFDDVLVGATGAVDGSGRVEVFPGSAAGLGATPLWSRVGVPQTGWGRIVGAAGDVNGDGFDDIVCSAAELGGFCGSQDLFLSSASGPLETPFYTFAQGIRAFGASRDFGQDGVPDALYIAKCTSSFELVVRNYAQGNVRGLEVYDPVAVTAGDLNGDGRTDAIASVPTFEYESFHGRVFAFTNLPPFPPVRAFPLYDGDQPGAGWGEALAAIDVDGDGADELFVGAPRQDSGETDEGIVVLFPGRKREVALLQTADSPRTTVQGRLAVGDFDADGFSDLITTRTVATEVLDAEVRHGSSTGLGTGADVVLVPPSGPARPYRRVESVSAGDANGDGHDDALVTFFTYEHFFGGDSGEFRNALYEGSVAGLGALPVASFPAITRFVGDVTGDGFDDALDLAPAPVFYLGSSSGLVATQTLPTAGALTFTGHLDGDGYLDVLLVQSNVQVAIYLGSPGGLVFDQTWWGFPSFSIQFLGLLDVDGDGVDELLVYDQSDSSKCRVWARAPGGFVRSPQWWESPDPPCCSSSSTNTRVVAIFDADLDGFADLLTATSSNASSLHTGSATGISRSQAWAGGMLWPGALLPFASQASADFDGDGNVELALSFSTEVRIYEARRL
jgi:hypothetical protein